MFYRSFAYYTVLAYYRDVPTIATWNKGARQYGRILLLGCLPALPQSVYLLCKQCSAELVYFVIHSVSEVEKVSVYENARPSKVVKVSVLIVQSRPVGITCLARCPPISPFFVFLVLA